MRRAQHDPWIVIIPSLQDPIYTVTVADSHEDKHGTYALRYEEYCVNMRSLAPEDYPNGLESDAFDANALHLIARYKNEVVGTIRVTFSLPENGRFLMETGDDGFDLPSWIPRPTSCEPSRLVGHQITSEYGPIRQSNILLEAACQWSYHHGYTHWVVAWQEQLYERLKTEGWPFNILGDAKTYHATRVLPVFLKLEELCSFFQGKR